MAEIYKFSEEQEKLWEAWVAERPPVIKAMAERLLPNRVYKLTTTEQICIPTAFHEDNTVKVAVLRALNNRIFSVSVFGINPDDLVECDLPNGIQLMSFKEFENLD